MIPISHLRDITTVIVHTSELGPCSDGRASAYLIHKVLPRAEIVEMAYNTRAHKSLATQRGLLFADFSPRACHVDDLLSVEPIVLDHHATAERVVRRFKYGVYADAKAEPGVSGAMLAYREVVIPLAPTFACAHCRFLQREAPCSCPSLVDLHEIARLIGIRDTWQKSSPDFQRASNLSEFLSFVALDDLLAMPPAEVLRQGQEMGPRIRAKTLADAQNAIRNATIMSFPGVDVYLFAGGRLSSDAATFLPAGAVGVSHDFIHEDGEMRMIFGLRAQGDIDVGALAKRMGGGGHRGASGFSVPVTMEWYRDPVSIVRGLFSGDLPR